MTATYTFPAHLLPDAEKRIMQANKRLVREGITERFEYETEVTEKTRPVTEAEVQRGFSPDQRVIERIATLTLSQPEIAHEGWEFLASVERAGQGVIVSTRPGVELGGYRPDPNHCDHCQTNRKRNRVYLVEKSGQRMQVGSTCLQAFLGIKPTGLWAIGYELPIPPAGTGEGIEIAYDLGEFIAEVLAVSEAGKSFVSRSGFGVASADDAIDTFHGHRPAPGALLDARDAYLEDGTVDAVLDAVRGLDESSDYGANMHALLSAEAITYRQLGLAASAVLVWKKKTRKDAEEKQAPVPGFVAEVGQRIREVPATVTRIQSFESFYGYRESVTTYLTLRSDEGKVIFWKASKDLDLDTGDSVLVTGTVIDHGQFRGVDQTVITRGKVQPCSQ